MQRVEMEELRQREANLTALQAIGPRKKPRIDGPDSFSSPGQVFSAQFFSLDINILNCCEQSKTSYSFKSRNCSLFVFCRLVTSVNL